MLLDLCFGLLKLVRLGLVELLKLLHYLLALRVSDLALQLQSNTVVVSPVEVLTQLRRQ